MGARPIDVSASFVDILHAAICDRSPLVRRIGAEMLIRNLDTLGPDAEGLAQRLAADATHSVAYRGQFALERMGELK